MNGKTAKNMAQYHQQTFIGWPWKIIPSVRCSVCGKAEHVAFSRCTRFMPNTCEQPYIHAYTHTHTYYLGSLGTLLSLAWLCGAESIWECGHMGSAVQPNPTIPQSLNLQMQRSQWLTYYIRQETLICSLSRVHVLLRGNSADAVCFWKVKGYSDWTSFPNDASVTILLTENGFDLGQYLVYTSALHKYWHPC